jgi:transposase
MFRLDEGMAVYLHREAVDFRKSINGLVAIIEQGLGHNPFAAACYVFRNHQRSKIKLVFWHKNGFWLCYKRLEQQRFIWPSGSDTLITLSVQQLHWLLEGINLAALNGHRALMYQRAS